MSQKKNLSILSNIDLKSLSAYYFPETADLYTVSVLRLLKTSISMLFPKFNM